MERGREERDEGARVGERQERVREGGGDGQQARDGRGEEEDRPLEQCRKEDEEEGLCLMLRRLNEGREGRGQPERVLHQKGHLRGARAERARQRAHVGTERPPP